MLADRLRCCHWLMFAVLLAPVFVRPKGIEVQKNDWATGEEKTKGGRFDSMVDKSGKNSSAASTDGSQGDPTTKLGLSELDNDPLAADSTEALAASANDSSGGGIAGWVWAILASLCAAGAALAGFSIYWSRMRKASAW